MKTYYQIVALTKTGKPWESNIIYKDYDQAVLQRKSLLLDSENIAYAMIRTLNAM